MIDPSPDRPVSPPNRARDLLLPLVIVGLALALRVWGLGWGLPNQDRHYPYHPDEAVVMTNGVNRVSLVLGDFVPGFYHYGTLPLLIARSFYEAGPMMHGEPFDLNRPFAAQVGAFAAQMLAGRWASVVFGLLSVLMTYALGRQLYGRRTGALAAAFFAVAPLPVILSHYVTVDAIGVFFVLAALYAAAVWLNDPQGTVSQIAWRAVVTGMLAGMAAGCKLNFAVAGLAALVPLVHAARSTPSKSWRVVVVGVLALGAGTAVGFLAATPGAVVEWSAFYAQTLEELRRSREGIGLQSAGMPWAGYYHLAVSLPISLEWPLYLVSLGGAVYSLRRRQAGDWLLWAFLLPTFLSLAFSARIFVRYALPLIPLLTLLAARGVSELLDQERFRRLGLALAGLAFLGALGSSAAHLRVMAGEDSRDAAARYLREQVSRDHIVALATDPWYYTPPIHPTAGNVKAFGLPMFGGPPVWDRSPSRGLYQLEAFRVLAPASTPPAGALTVAQLRLHQPEWVVVSDFQYEDSERLRTGDPSYSDAVLALMDELRAAYDLAEEFRPRPRLGPLVWWRRGTPPHDWRYYMPTVRVYRRRPGGSNEGSTPPSVN